MTTERANEILHLDEECSNRKESCDWHCEICAYGDYTMNELEEAKEMINND